MTYVSARDKDKSRPDDTTADNLDAMEMMSS